MILQTQTQLISADITLLSGLLDEIWEVIDPSITSLTSKILSVPELEAIIKEYKKENHTQRLKINTVSAYKPG